MNAELRRIAPADQRLRVKLGEWLARLGGNVAGDLLEDGPFTRGLVVLWGPDGPVATWMGRLTQDELYRDTSSVLRELIEPEGMRPSDYREEREKAEKAEEAAKPFVCRRKGGWSQAEILLSVQLEQAGILFEREIRFSSRRFRADFGVGVPWGGKWPILIEVEGGTWIEGRHSRGRGFEADCEKQALAVIAGYRYLRVTSAQVEDGRALDWIRQALGISEVAA